MCLILYQSCCWETTTKNLDNWTVKNLEKFKDFIERTSWWIKNLKTVNSEIKQNESQLNWQGYDGWNDHPVETLIWEFDPGSGWTLAACLTHASRTKHLIRFLSGMKILWLSGGRVSNAWVTCLIQGDNSWKRLLIPHKRTASHGAVWKTPVVWDGPASD